MPLHCSTLACRRKEASAGRKHLQLSPHALVLLQLAYDYVTKGGGVFVDNRSPAEFQAAHLPGSINAVVIFEVGLLVDQALRVDPGPHGCPVN